jgi:putative PepSY-like beta-lactamase-inhibitor
MVDRFDSRSQNLFSPYATLSFAGYTASASENHAARPPGRASRISNRRLVMWKLVQPVFLAFVGLSLAAACACGDEQKISLDDVPTAVKDAVKKKFPDAKLEKAEKEVENGQTTFEILVKDNDKKITVSLKDDGTIVEIEKEIDAKDLPEAVGSAVKAKYPSGIVKKAEEVTKDEKITYEVILAQEGKKLREIALDKSGKITEDEETDGEDD